MSKEKIEVYNHHGVDVFTMSKIKGMHRDFCLCFQGCKKFKPQDSDHCPIAAANFENCVKYSTTQPVFECPNYDGE